jgi:predicted NBD/HSP70 family sugar kinase
MLLKKNDSKRTNKLNILQIVRHSGETTKPALAKALGISMPTSSSLVDELIGEGFLQISGIGASTEQGGKKPKLITLNPQGRYAAALHIGARKVEGAVVDLLGGLHHRLSEPLPPHRTQQAVGRALSAVAGRVLELARSADMPVVGIGVGLPGLVDRHKGPTTAVNFSEVNGLRIDRELEPFGLPVWIDNECRNSALAEQWFGLGRQKRNFVSLFTDGGIGAGFLIDGQMVRGMDESFGEIGHTVIQMDGRPCRCGNHGCWETYASSDALLETVRDRLHEADWLNARVMSGEPLTVALIVQALERSNAVELREAGSRPADEGSGAESRERQADGGGSAEIHASLPDFDGNAGTPTGLGGVAVSESDFTASINRENRVIQAAINELGDYLAVGLGNIVNLFNPELIVIHGEMTMLGEPLLSRVRQSLLGRALPAAAARADIRFTGFGEHANLIGAGSLAWRETFDEPELLFP